MTDSVTITIPRGDAVRIRGIYVRWVRNAGWTPRLPTAWFDPYFGGDTTTRVADVNVTPAGQIELTFRRAANFAASVRSGLMLTMTAAGVTAVAAAPFGGSDTNAPYIWTPVNAADWIALYNAVIDADADEGATLTFALAQALEAAPLPIGAGFAPATFAKPFIVPAALPIGAGFEGRISPALVARPLGLGAGFRPPTFGNARRGEPLPISVALPRAALSPPPPLRGGPLGIAAGLPDADLPAPILRGRRLALGISLERAVLPPPPALAAEALRLALGLPDASIPLPDAGITAHPLPLAFALAGQFVPPPIVARPLALSVDLTGRLVYRAPPGPVVELASTPGVRLVTGIEVRHPAAPTPIRLVDDTEPITIAGETYLASRFEARLADDVDRRAPTAEVAIGNTGRDMSDWLELTGGGADGTVRIFQIIRGPGDAPEPEWELTLDVVGASATDTVVLTLGFDPLLGRPAVALRYDPQTAPGLF